MDGGGPDARPEWLVGLEFTVIFPTARKSPTMSRPRIECQNEPNSTGALREGSCAQASLSHDYHCLDMAFPITFTSLCAAIVDSIWEPDAFQHAAKSRPRMLPTRRWTTLGGGYRARCAAKSASLVTITKSFCCACAGSRRSRTRSAWVTGRRVCRMERAGGSRRRGNPLMPRARTSNGSPSVGPHDPAQASTCSRRSEGAPSTHPPRNLPPPASPAPDWTAIRVPRSTGRPLHLDESQSSLNSYAKTGPLPDCRQAQFTPESKTELNRSKQRTREATRSRSLHPHNAGAELQSRHSSAFGAGGRRHRQLYQLTFARITRSRATSPGLASLSIATIREGLPRLRGDLARSELLGQAPASAFGRIARASIRTTGGAPTS